MSANLSPSTAQDRAAALEASAARHRWLSWVTPVVGVLLALVLSTAWRQGVHPFIAHDDWEYELPAGFPSAIDLFERNRYEGRWLNYVWWMAFSSRATVVVSSVLFLALYAAHVVAFTRLVCRGWVSLVAAYALFVSPLWMQLSVWPATQTASVLLLAIALFWLPRVLGSTAGTLTWLFIFSVLSVLSYPPVAAIAFLACVMAEPRLSLRRLAVRAVVYVGSFGVGVLTAFTINKVALGSFGVEPRPWRQPNPLETPADLAENLGVSARQFISLWEYLAVPGAVALVLVVLALLSAGTRHETGIFLLALLVVAAVESGQTVINGTPVAARGSLWAWVAVCGPGIILARAVSWRVVVAALGIGAIGAWGSVAWIEGIGVRQETREFYDRVGMKVDRALDRGARDVVMYVEPDLRADGRAYTHHRSLRLAVYEEHDVMPRACRARECAALDDVMSRHRDRTVVRWEGVAVIRMPAAPEWM